MENKATRKLTANEKFERYLRDDINLTSSYKRIKGFEDYWIGRQGVYSEKSGIFLEPPDRGDYVSIITLCGKNGKRKTTSLCKLFDETFSAEETRYMKLDSA